MCPCPNSLHLRLERPSDGVAVLTLDNPDQRNAMSDAMTASWVAAIDELAADRSVRVVVVTGEGSAFCSGGDTSWIASEPDASVDHLRTRMIAFYRAWLSIRRLEVPTIAAINGPAIGAGLCLALACDLRYAAAGPGSAPRSSSSACTPGWPARSCSRTSWARRTPATCCSPGGWSTPTRRSGSAWSRGSSTRRRSAPRCRRSPRAVAATAPIASRLTKLALADGGHADFESCLQWEAMAQPITLATADLQEGIRAARERRPAAFTGA